MRMTTERWTGGIAAVAAAIALALGGCGGAMTGGSGMAGDGTMKPDGMMKPEGTMKKDGSMMEKTR